MAPADFETLIAEGREDNRRVPNGDQVNRVAGLALANKPSVDFGGYWQRHLGERVI